MDDDLKYQELNISTTPGWIASNLSKYWPDPPQILYLGYVTKVYFTKVYRIKLDL